MIFSFQTRIVLLFSLLFAGVQTLTLTTVYELARHNVTQQVEQNLVYAGRIFNRLLTSRGERMAAEVAILSADYGFRSTIYNGDANTLRSALQNLMLRIHAQRVFFIEPRGKINADTGSTLEQSTFPFPIALSLAENNGRAVCFALIDGLPHILAAVQVLAPIPIGWIAVAIRVDDGFVGHFKQLSPAAMEITLLEQTPQTQRILASTLNAGQQQRLAPLHTQLVRIDENQPQTITIGDGQWATLRLPLPSGDGQQNLAALLQIDLAGALVSYQSFWWSAAGLFCLGLIAILLGGLFLARQVSKPVRQLSQAVGRIDAGDFSHPISHFRQDELGRLAQAFNHMMQGIAEREAHIARQLRHDSVTGLPNRLYLEENLAERVRLGKPYAILLIGLSRYAEINSTLGHELGDQLIHAVYTALRGQLPDDAVIALLAGDEFAVAVDSHNDDAALANLAKQAHLAFQKPFNVGAAMVDVNVHMGLIPSSHGYHPQALLRKADAALFVARRSGQLFHIYQEATDPCQPEALSLMGELRAGLEAGQFNLYVQPQLDLRHGQISHVECLIRWRHPERGFLPPDTFIPMAEQTGHIHHLTHWVLHEAFRLRHYWQQAGLDIKLAVNLSAQDLQENLLTEHLDALLARYPVSADGFILEITESAVMQDAEQALSLLKTVNARGFLLSVDDFGTGYSSMAYLQKLPLHELKIDKAFIKNLAGKPEDAVIAHSIIDLAHNLGLVVVAEGVENAQGLTILQQLGCDLAQGYWIGKPMPSSEFITWLQQSEWPPASETP